MQDNIRRNMRQEAQQILNIPLQDIIPYKNNPRNNTKSIEKLVESISRYGFRVPIVVNANMVIITGHTRYEAVKRLGWDTIPAIVARDLTPEQEQAYRIVDNKVQDFSKWDNKKLQEEVDDLYKTFGVSLESFEILNPRTLVTADEWEPSEEILQDPIAAEYINTVWRLGRHVLIHGDATEINPVELSLPEIDMIMIDPPYGVSYTGGVVSTERENIINDDLDKESIGRLLDRAYNIWSPRLVPGGSVYVWFTADIRPIYSSAEANGIHIKQTLTWVKSRFTVTRSHYKFATERIYYGHKGENCAYGWKEDGASAWYGGFDKSDVFEAPKPQTSVIHPTMKPLSILGEMIQNSSPPHGVVADFFSGSGSTLIACEQTGRTCIAKELNPQFVKAIIERWEQLTGLKAERIE